MSIIRTYSISLDMPGGILSNPAKLQVEIAAPGNGISTKLNGISTSGDDLNLTFETELSSAEITALDGDAGTPHATHPASGLLAAHDDSPSAQIANLVSINNVPTVYTRKPVGIGRAYGFSIDFCKKETWYHESTKVTDETVGTGDGTTTVFQLAHGTGSVSGEAIVDLCHGKVTDEDNVAPPSGAPGGYVPVIKVGGVTKTEREYAEASGGDYSINYTTGAVTFYTAPASGAITATYFYVAATSGPIIILKPGSGKKFEFSKAEWQFSSDVEMLDTIISEPRMANHPQYGDIAVAPVTKIKNIGNLLDWGSGSFPIVPAHGGTTRGTTKDTIIGRVAYESAIVLLSSLTFYIKIYTAHGRGFSGERATLVYYGFESDE